MKKDEKKLKEIWILEDDEGCQFVYNQILRNDFKTTYFDSIQKFRKAFEFLEDDPPVMIIADLMLRDGNFLKFLTHEYKEKLKIPLIIVSSDDDLESLRLCFKQGAHDYITKPFRKNELLVKIEAILRNKKSLTKSLRPQISLDGNIIDNLTGKQAKLLELFIGSDNREIGRQMIIDEVWGGDVIHPKTIDVHLYNLRRKLRSDGYMIRSEGGGRWRLLTDTLTQE